MSAYNRHATLRDGGNRLNCGILRSHCVCISCANLHTLREFRFRLPQEEGQEGESRLRPGTVVPIIHMAVSSRPRIEGHAHLIQPTGGLPDLWRVRFDGEAITRLRLVHGGDWQRRPNAMLRALTQEWRLGLQPEHLLESPFPERG